ncbi:hypothetical protein BMG_2073 [Priestia megaterium]|uniref:Uncharacterized protein n=1 Tax=Priestia megaterium (strain ATCC 12872 / QMB1551) TaxID=545693 RepID=D5DZP5_PRIM1|nr:hypothetical protein BMQ_3424 [Priestia megaterium QM B1551]QLK05568.1 hypothetical protein BMG_2073 [Priestia megaterium]
MLRATILLGFLGTLTGPASDLYVIVSLLVSPLSFPFVVSLFPQALTIIASISRNGIKNSFFSLISSFFTLFLFDNDNLYQLLLCIYYTSVTTIVNNYKIFHQRKKGLYLRGLFLLLHSSHLVKLTRFS